MGSSEDMRQHAEEQVDLDADTKESTEEVFFQRDTVESPHKITCYYPHTLDSKIANHLPTCIQKRIVGRELKFGRNRASDVLLNEEHMSKDFATLTCRKNQTNDASFYLRNVSSKKRILVTDENGSKKELMPSQEIELRERMRFRLESLELVVGIELGDVNSQMFELAVKPLPQEAGQTNGYVGGGVVVPDQSAANPHVGLPIPNNRPQSQTPINASPVQFYQHPQAANAAYPQATTAAYPQAATAAYPQAQTAAYPQAQTAAYQQAATVAYPQVQAVGNQPMLSPYSQVPFVSNPMMQFGYPDLFSQPSAMHPSNMYQPAQPISHHTVPHQAVPHQVMNPPPLVERGAGAGYLGPGQPYQHHPDQGPYNMSMMSQTLPKQPQCNPQTGLSPRGIVANPSSQDHRPVLYPSPANQRFRFPEPQIRTDGPLSPDLTNLPRGPPLARLSSSRSVDLHPGIPSNVVTTHPIRETGASRDRHQDMKMPVEHEDKPK